MGGGLVPHMYVTMVIRDAAVCIYTVHEGLLLKKMRTGTSGIYLHMHSYLKRLVMGVSRGGGRWGPDTWKTQVATCFIRNTGTDGPL